MFEVGRLRDRRGAICQAVKNTSFLDAVAAGIQHEKDFFDFCMKTHDELAAGPVKNFFFDLAEDSVEHIKLIESIYKKYSGSTDLPNLKHLGQVHKFHATAIQRLIRKLDRNLKQSTQGSEFEALRLAHCKRRKMPQKHSPNLPTSLPTPVSKCCLGRCRASTKNDRSCSKVRSGLPAPADRRCCRTGIPSRSCERRTVATDKACCQSGA
jgi:hypothetical protein